MYSATKDNEQIISSVLRPSSILLVQASQLLMLESVLSNAGTVSSFPCSEVIHSQASELGTVTDGDSVVESILCLGREDVMCRNKCSN